MKAPPSHTFIECSDENDFVDRCVDSEKKKEQGKANPNSDNSKTVPDLLKWISDVTIKRRKYRKRYRCSHLLAEAVLSNTLRNARTELALKQEEKRKKAQEFSYLLNIKFQQLEDKENEEQNNSQGKVDDNNNDIEQKANYFNKNPFPSQKANDYSNNMQIDDNDEHVQACISSLDNFFSELKSIKV